MPPAVSRDCEATETEKTLGLATPDILLERPVPVSFAVASFVELPVIVALGSAEMVIDTPIPLALTSLRWVNDFEFEIDIEVSQLHDRK